MVILLISSVVAQDELPDIPIEDDIIGVNVFVDEKPILLVDDLTKATSIIESLNLQGGQDEDMWRQNIQDFLENDFNITYNNNTTNNLTYF